MLHVSNLKAAYGKIEALHGISFHVEKGEIVTLIGANGAGKSTTLKALMRLRPPEAPTVTGGEIAFNGVSLLGMPAYRVVSKIGMTLAPEGRRIFGNLTVMENLQLAFWSRKGENVDKEVQRIFDLFPRLAERARQRSDTLSGGEQQMLAVGRALMTKCSVLLLDEPSMGLAPLIMYDLFRTLKKLNTDEGLTIIVVEQNAHLALQVADRGYVLDTGEIVAEGAAQELLHKPEIKTAYLGG
ncbi:MAG: ABC transporter ATP-binding protein [Burkholderiaceae bacterium]|jgi:branched-chain amino acid transport system ATP-binding protein|nr:ABC transporter ATP-binding protein [Burkholderiaceae bacterium]